MAARAQPVGNLEGDIAGRVTEDIGGVCASREPHDPKESYTRKLTSEVSVVSLSVEPRTEPREFDDDQGGERAASEVVDHEPRRDNEASSVMTRCRVHNTYIAGTVKLRSEVATASAA